MSVKFRIGLTIDGETLFGLMAKMLPIEDLSVEEVVQQSPGVVKARAKESLPKPRAKFKRASPGPNLEKGLNGIVIVALKEGPLRTVDLQPKIIAAGYSANSVASRLETLLKFGVIERVGDGTWRLK